METTGVRPPLPVPPPGWGAAVLANKDKLKNRPEFVAKGLDKADVDWLAVGRGETWAHTQFRWDAVLALAGRLAFVSAFFGLLVALVYPTVVTGLAAWRARRFAGRCMRCGYRIGIPNAERCPECGASSPQS